MSGCHRSSHRTARTLVLEELTQPARQGTDTQIDEATGKETPAREQDIHW